MVICLELGADLHMAQLMPLPLPISCFIKIQIGYTFLVLAHPGCPGKRAVKWVCVCVTILQTILTRALQLALALPYYTEHINTHTQTQTDKKKYNKLVALELWGLVPPVPPSQKCGLCQNFKQTTLSTRLHEVRTNLYSPTYENIPSACNKYN